MVPGNLLPFVQVVVSVAVSWLGGRDSNPDTVVQRSVSGFRSASLRYGLLRSSPLPLRFASLRFGGFSCNSSLCVSPLCRSVSDGLSEGGDSTKARQIKQISGHCRHSRRSATQRVRRGVVNGQRRSDVRLIAPIPALSTVTVGASLRQSKRPIETPEKPVSEI